MFLSQQDLHQEDEGQPPQGQKAPDYRFLALAQESADIFWCLSPAGLMQEMSSSWHIFTGQEECDGLGRGWLDALYPADQRQVEETVIHSVTSLHSVEMECHLRRFDRIYRLVRLRVIPVREDHGRIGEVIICGNDITQQELAGQMSEAEVELAVEASGVGVWDWDLVTNQVQVSDQGKALFGLSRNDLMTHERFLTLLHPGDRGRVEELIARALSEQTDYHTEYRTMWPDGSIHWLASRGRILFDRESQPTHLIGTVMDITDLKQAEERITTILESITDAFSHVDRQWRYTYVNRGIEKLMGKKREEVLGRSLWEMVPTVLGTPFEHTYRQAWETQQTTYIEGFHPDFRRWLEIRVYPTPDGLSFYLHDITERKRAEEALRESEARFRRLMESNLFGIAVVDTQEDTVYEANDAFLQLLGYTQEDLAAGRIQWAGLSPPEYQEQGAKAKEELLTTGAFHVMEKEYVRKDGTRIPVQVWGTLLTREGSEPSALCFVLDLSARKEIERQKDLMLGMTGHELKTPLAALRGMLQLIRRRMKRVVSAEEHLSSAMSIFFDKLTESVEDSLRQIDVQTHLINDLLDVSRITAGTLKLELELCDLVPLVRETVEDLRVTAPERSLVLDVSEQTAVMVLADRARIGQVVTNYVTNALRYSPPDQPVHIGLTLQSDVARVWVRDQGPGLSEAAQKELWQRFCQIKGVPVQSGSGKGLGLGLYICQTLIAGHQGEVGVESTPGEGSTFWFTLPIVT
jgi:PAS domain S-box-containing protein